MVCYTFFDTKFIIFVVLDSVKINYVLILK